MKNKNKMWWMMFLVVILSKDSVSTIWDHHKDHTNNFHGSTLDVQENEIDGHKISLPQTTVGLDHTRSESEKIKNEPNVFLRLLPRGRIGPKSPASHLHEEVDLLKLLNVSSAKNPGVSLVEGPIKGFNAYKFRLPYGDMPIANSTNITEAMNKNKGFTVIFLYRQQKNNLGTLLSINSPGRLTPWFQITSNLKTGVLTVKYRTDGGSKVHQIDWILPNHHKKSPLAAWTWLSISADFNTGTIWMDLDCQPSRFESIDNASSLTKKKKKRNTSSKIGIPRNALVYFRQEPGRKKKFLGSIQVAKVLPYITQGRLWSCMHITDKPVSPEHRKPLL